MFAADNNNHQGSWGSILLIYGIGVLGATTISQAITVARDMAAFFHAAPQQAGWIISTPSALVVIGAVLTGWLVDRIGDKPILLLGCAVVIAGDVGVTLAGTFASLLAMRVVEGIGYVGIAVAAVTMLMRITQGPRRNVALSLWSSFIPMSFAVPLLLTARLAGTGEWRWAFVGQAIALGVLALLAAATLPARGTTAGPQRTAGLGVVLRSPGAYLLGLSFAAHAFVQTGLVSTLPHTLAALYGVTFATVGAVGVVAAGIAAGSTLSDFGTAIVIACAFFLASGLIAGLWALLPDVAPASALGAASGLVTQITLLGVLFGPPAAFAAKASGDWTRTVMNIALAGTAMWVLLWLVIRKFSSAGARDGVEPRISVAH
jgi:DHA1 family inner membrane transport protein